ncbi:hypothetical protein DsansV1_C27g0200491 [Dioscorea sansibarensis]
MRERDDGTEPELNMGTWPSFHYLIHSELSTSASDLYHLVKPERG